MQASWPGLPARGYKYNFNAAKLLTGTMQNKVPVKIFLQKLFLPGKLPEIRDEIQVL
jgi:hypothetical protein